MWSIPADNRGNLQKSCRIAPSPRFPGLGTWCIIPHRSRSLMRSWSWQNPASPEAERKPLMRLLSADAAQLMRVTKSTQHLRGFGAFIYYGPRSRVAVVRCAGHHADCRGADGIRGAWLGVPAGGSVRDSRGIGL